MFEGLLLMLSYRLSLMYSCYYISLRYTSDNIFAVKQIKTIYLLTFTIYIINYVSSALKNTTYPTIITNYPLLRLQNNKIKCDVISEDMPFQWQCKEQKKE